ncbi:hypothetical protein [Paeniglutamicibacter sp. Y32M11]|uniref:hypothetical protein n=1 Tax=Paeniglutamicibacter sp. Y32M11 TaxID=2853258 RepID=UPI001C533653|nr:hypothetical protein [Paeniglutamicibacter sp. Y32M11]QXQ09431.1 hypothetical protein KUF55_13215 [Paeniglutamicibacter sp. Y32M11]
MSTPENNPQNPQTPSGEPTPPQYGQRAPLDPNAAGQTPQFGAQQPNPYGQNPNPYGQPEQSNSPYGQQPYPGGFQVPPQGNFPAPQMPTQRPKELDTSFWAILAAGVFFLASMLLTLTDSAIRDSLTMAPEMEDLLAQSGSSLEQMIPMVRIFVIVFALIGLGIYVLLAFMVRKGSNVARIFATVLAALSLFNLAGGLIMVVAVILGIVGVVFAWLRPSSQYIAARRAARAAGFRG